MPATIQRNILVAPFSVNSPLMEKSDGKKPAPVAVTHQKWFQSVANGINASPQITATIPSSSASAGQPGQIAFDSSWLYVCVGLNIWRRTPLAVF